MYEIERLDKFIEMLTRINSMPAGKVKKEIDSLKMSFPDWCSLTNQEYNPYQMSSYTKYAQIDLSDKSMLQYSDYLAAIEHFGNTDYAESVSEKRNKQQRYIEQQIKYYGKVVLDEEEIPYEYEQKLLQIRGLWNALMMKYDPIKGILKVCDSAKKCIKDYNSGWDELEIVVIGKFEKYAKYISEMYGENPQTEELQNELLETMKKIVQKIKASTELMSDEEKEDLQPYWEIEEDIRLNEGKDLEDLITSYREALQALSTNAKADPLTEMSIQQLIDMIEENDKTILQNEKSIKEMLVKKILSQQQQIEAQEAEMARLNGQKEQK